MFDIEGKLVSVDVRESRWPLRPQSRSILQQKVKEAILAKYPRCRLLEEFFLPGSRLSIDLLMIDSKKAYEIDGKQHSSHTPVFHGQRNLNKFAGQVKNDRMKEEWCLLNGIELIRITEDDNIEEKI